MTGQAGGTSNCHPLPPAVQSCHGILASSDTEGTGLGDTKELEAAFKALREGDGLNAEKLGDHEYTWLLDLLMTPGNPGAGLTVLDQLIGGLLDADNAWALRDLGPKMKASKHLIPRAVRVGLAIGKDYEGNDLVTHGILTQRRRWACGVEVFKPETELFFAQTDERTHRRYEDYGFVVLARLLLQRAGKIDVPVPKKSRVQPYDADLAEANGQSTASTVADDAPTNDGDHDRPVDIESESAPITDTAIKDLPTFPQAFRSLRDAFTRMEFLLIPERLRMRESMETGFKIGIAIGAVAVVITLIVTLKITGYL